MIRLLRVFANFSSEDTALNAVRGRLELNVVRNIRQNLRISVTLIAFTCGVAAFSIPTSVPAVNASQTAPPLVALASSFRTVWPILMDAYREETNNAAPLTSFGSSGLLSTQILRGAPFELFLSADQRSVKRIMGAGKTQTDPIALAHGTLSLVTLLGVGNTSDNAPTFARIRESLLTTGSSFKIAIANPRHAPYGLAAQQALTNAGLWPLPKGTLLRAENASQALQYVLSGAATLAIVPTALVTQRLFELNMSVIDPGSYEPVIHYLAILTPAGDAARKLSVWLTTPRALAIMSQSGLAHWAP